MIENYSFGSINIDGKVYNYDAEVRWTGEVLPWRREESHIIDYKDAERALFEKPEIIIIGTGESGLAEVTESAKRNIENKRIELVVDQSGSATEIFNTLQKEKKKVIGLFHLTC